MADKDAIVRSYAEALFRVADAEGELDAVERRLFAFAELLERETRVRDALLDPSLPIENKRQLIADTLRERANPLAVNLLGFLVTVNAFAVRVPLDLPARGGRGYPRSAAELLGLVVDRTGRQHPADGRRNDPGS